jgi:hypothetical protein
MPTPLGWGKQVFSYCEIMNVRQKIFNHYTMNLWLAGVCPVVDKGMD